MSRDTTIMDPHIVNVREANCGYEFHCEFRNFPVTFVNAIRRILLSKLPIVVIRDIDILENTTQMPHEMLRHRVSMLPVNVHPEDKNTIRDTKIELFVKTDKDAKTITTKDFAIQSNRTNLLMNDRDYDEPLLLVRMRPNETLHIKASLGVDSDIGVSHVCTATTMWHIDEELAKEARQSWIEDDEGAPAVFDNFYIQKYYSRNEKGRPDWIDLNVESVGVMSGKELVRMAVRVLRNKLDSYMKEAIPNIETMKNDEFVIAVQQGEHTICALVQEVMYNLEDGESKPLVNFVSYDIPHPLRTDTVVRFHTKHHSEDVVNKVYSTIKEYCDVIEKGL